MSRLHNLRRLTRLAKTVFHANREAGNYHKQVQREAADIIAQSKAINEQASEGKLSDRMFKKLQWYMVTHLLMGEMFADLEGRKLTKAEQLCYMILGPVLGLSDILIDDFKFDESQINQLLQADYQSVSNHGVEQIFQLYNSALYESTPKECHAHLTKVFKDFHKSQIDSGHQFDPNISSEELERVIMEKGGTSVLLCRAILSPMTEIEEKAYYQVGGLMQKMNDAVDLYKDGKEGIVTSANSLPNMESMIARLQEQKEAAFAALRQMKFPAARIDDFMFVFHIYVVSVEFKLDEYRRKCGGTFTMEKYLNLDKKTAASQPFSIRSGHFSLWKILNYVPFKNS